jgi:hypothetical protein
MTGYHFPARVTDLFASSAAASTQIFLQWTTPGNDGLELNTPGAYVVRYSSLAAESPAISDAKFNAASVVTPAPPAAQAAGSRLTMNVTGLAAGVTYYFAIKTAERDGTRSILSAGATAQTVAPYGCFITRNVHKVDGPYTTIQSAVDSLPQSLNGHACVIVRDSASYDEQVTVRNFTNNGSSITIASDPSLTNRPRVNPLLTTSTAAFLVANSSVNIYGFDIRVAASIQYGVWSSSSYVRISSVSVSTAGTAGIWTAGVRVSSWTSIDNTTVTVGAAHALWLDRATMTAVHNSSFQARGPSVFAVWFNGASSNTFNASVSSNSLGAGMSFDQNALSNVVSLSTSYAATDAVSLTGASSNTFTRAYLRAGAGRGIVAAGSNFLRLVNSTSTAADDGLELTGSSSATVTGSVLRSAGTYGINQDAASSALRVDGSTVASTGAGNAGWMMRGSTNVVTNTYVQNVASNAGGLTMVGSNANVLDGVQVAGENSGVNLSNSSTNTIRNSTLSARTSAGGGLNLSQGAFNNDVAFSTVTNSNASGIALILTRTSTNTLWNLYVQASTGVLVDGSTGTALVHSVVAATSGNGTGVKLGAGVVNFAMSSTTLLGTTSGGTASRGVYMENGNRGAIDISSSLISGFHRGIAIATQTPTTRLWVTSNTIVVPVVAAADTYGLRVDGLQSGATIQDNSIVFRTPGAAQYAAGAWFEAADGVVFQRNRLSNPGMVTSGVSELLRLADSDGMEIFSNDFHSTGTALSQAYLLRLTTGSVNVSLRGNVFSSSLTVTGSSFTIAVAADSQSGFDSDYNDFFSSNSALSFQWGASAVQNLAGWQGASGDDAASISAHPQWYDVSAGVEDFHPRSTQGRWNPGTSAFVLDGTSSPTLDQGDPTHAYDLEPQPSGGRVNQGSYANTGYASKSLNTYPGCVAASLVNKTGGPYTTIQAGVNALPASLAGHSCVVIKDGATYAEQVTVLLEALSR